MLRPKAGKLSGRVLDLDLDVIAYHADLADDGDVPGRRADGFAGFKLQACRGVG